MLTVTRFSYLLKCKRKFDFFSCGESRLSCCLSNFETCAIPSLSGVQRAVYAAGSLVVCKQTVLCWFFRHDKRFTLYLCQLICKNISSILSDFLQEGILKQMSSSIAYFPAENNSHSMSPVIRSNRSARTVTIQTVKGWVVFLPLPFRRWKRGTRFYNPAPFSSALFQR